MSSMPTSPAELLASPTASDVVLDVLSHHLRSDAALDSGRQSPTVEERVT
ncbi:hypothetical protein CCACVL1_03190 [Corchorus capsularis]|uniref:Uncharacterized protein n=1 Tax=Corchorus capsularis TaxID=210143 RepID=A0A1R3K1S0_COCAP|nr:hypothetical protein CCACVL1_03190 [Corchorus capsularis]